MPSWFRHQSLQTRLSSLVAAAVGVAIALAAIASYFAVSHQLYKQVDNTLNGYIGELAADHYNTGPALGIAANSGAQIQYITGTGQAQTLGSTTAAAIPSTNQEKALVAATPGTDLLTTTSADGQSYRVITASGFSVGSTPVALQIVQPLGPTEHALATLRLILYLVALAGIGVAIGLGLAVARATIRPVKRLTAAAEHVALTQNLDAQIDEDRDDELGRLAHAFNNMLAALRSSRRQQAQLISDAGHELRTPLTSLRTNIEFLMRAKEMPDTDRDNLLGDVRDQLEELTTLIGDIVDTARQDEQQPDPVEVRLDDIVDRAVDRARRRAPSLTFDVRATAGSVRAQPQLLERAILNVLDNAAKWSPPRGTVEVRLTRGEHWLLTIRDHGPGIDPADLPKVFDRFYRAPTARSMPGSGLGLAIVAHVVSAHGGTVTATRPAEGGTLVAIQLPVVVEEEPPAPPPVVERADLERPVASGSFSLLAPPARLTYSEAGQSGQQGET